MPVMCSELNRAEELLNRLVACPSVNPEAGPSGADIFGEARMATLLAEIVGGWGGVISRTDLGEGRQNFMVTWPGVDQRRSLLLEAHADTVAVDRMTVPPFGPMVREGKLYGRGACDTKGSIAAMLLAIRRALDGQAKPPVTIHFASTADEEGGAAGAIRLMADGFRPSAAIIGEPTDMAVACAHKGACRFRITTHGRAAHSSVPSQGINAVELMAHIVTAVEHEMAAELASRDGGTLGKPTICVTRITGGHAVNIVPGQCQIEVDRRCLPGENRAGLEAHMRDLLDGIMDQCPGACYELEVFQWYPALAAEEDGLLASAMLQACEKVTGSGRRVVVPYATNAGFFSEAGIPCVVFGPGSIKQAHTVDEYVELEQVVQASRVYEEMIHRFGACSL